MQGRTECKKHTRTTEQRERKFSKVRKCQDFCAASRAVGIFLLFIMIVLGCGLFIYFCLVFFLNKCTSSTATEAFIPNFFNTVTNLIKMIAVDSYFGYKLLYL